MRPARAAAWPLAAALSMVAGSVVPIQSPARKKPGTAVSVRGTGRRLRAPPRRWRAAPAPRDHAAPRPSRAAGITSRTVANAESTSASFVSSGHAVRGAGHHRQLAGRSPAPRPRRTPTASGRPGSPTKRDVHHAAVEPQVRRDNRRRRRGGRRLPDRAKRRPVDPGTAARARATPRRRSPRARATGAPRPRTAATCIAVEDQPRLRLRPHLPPAPFDERARRRARTARRSGDGRQRQRRARRVRAACGSTTSANGAAAATSIGWFSAASASGSHSSSIRRGVWPWRASQPSTVSDGSGVARAASRSADSRVAASPAPAIATARRAGCSGDGSGGHASRDQRPRRSTLSTTGRAESRRSTRRRCGAGRRRSRRSSPSGCAARCRRVSPVAASVIRGRATAQLGPGLEQHHPRAAFRQAGRRAQTGHAAADDDDVGLRPRRRRKRPPDPACRYRRRSGRKGANRLTTHRRSAISARRHRGTRITRENTSYLAPLDAAQDAEVDRAHDLCGHQAAAVGRAADARPACR